MINLTESGVVKLRSAIAVAIGQYSPPTARGLLYS
jgi:hypothetical protein